MKRRPGVRVRQILVHALVVNLVHRRNVAGRTDLGAKGEPTAQENLPVIVSHGEKAVTVEIVSQQQQSQPAASRFAALCDDAPVDSKRHGAGYAVMTGHEVIAEGSYRRLRAILEGAKVAAAERRDAYSDQNGSQHECSPADLHLAAFVPIEPQ